MQYYVYEHIRLDNAVPFYIGKGTVKNRRAYVSSSKPKAWKKIADVAGFRPRIIKYFNSNEESLAFEAEIQPKYAELGIVLVNRAKCGLRSGCEGFSHSEEAKTRIAAASKKAWDNPEYANKISQRAKGLRNPFADHNKYDFWHPTHGYLTCTQYELRSKYLLNDSHVSNVVRGSRYETKGWRLAINKGRPDSRQKHQIFKLFHPDHGIFTGTKLDFQKAFPEMEQSRVCRLLSGKYNSSGGWVVKEDNDPSLPPNVIWSK
jgi:hypothetical protein